MLLAKLKKELAAAEKEVVGGERNRVGGGRWPLRGEEYRRYGRQMIVPSVGIQGIYFPPYLPSFHFLLLGVMIFEFDKGI